MTQAERQKRSKEEIYQAALEEFGKADFEAVTMDSICLNHSISKGMMYHYYANKSELFLACAQEIFRELNDYLRHEAEALEDQPAFEAIKHYFLLRELGCSIPVSGIRLQSIVWASYSCTARRCGAPP